MRRRLFAMVAVALLASVLAGPAAAAKPGITVTVSGPTAGCAGVEVRASWDRPKRGQALLTIRLDDANGFYRLWAVIPIGPSDTSGSWSWTIDSSPGFAGSLTAHAYVNRDLNDPIKTYALLLEGQSAPALQVPGCNILFDQPTGVGV